MWTSEARPAVEQREMALRAGEPALAYTLVRRRGRRSVGLRVDASGLTVSAPLSVPLRYIEQAIAESEAWIRRKLAIWLARQVSPQAWSAGARLPYLGGEVTLAVRVAGRSAAALDGDTLHVRSRGDDPESVRRVVVAWYRREALRHFTGRTAELARNAGLAMPRLLVSSALSRWGSCNSRGEVRLAWRLVKAPPAVIDYVICHELAHLRHMNHSPAFWSEVERLCPDHRPLRAQLEAKDPLYRSF